VTLIEFSDFHCTYCNQAEPVLTQLLPKYSDRVKLVHKSFPLDVSIPLLGSQQSPDIVQMSGGSCGPISRNSHTDSDRILGIRI
jgi:DSBA-like thioredoxin domain-containing protein